MMKRFLSVLFLSALGFTAAAFDEAANEENKNTLRRAMEASARASYTADIPDPDPLFDRYTRGVYYRRSNTDGSVLRRVELYQGSVLKEVYIANASGQYALDGGEAMKISEIPVLFWPDHLFADVGELDWKYSLCSIRDIRHNRRACYEVTLTNPDYLPSLVGVLSGVSLPEAEDPNNQIYFTRPFVRVFIIDRDSDVILSRTHYNARGGMIFTQTLGKADLGARPGSEYFVTPEKVVGEVGYRYDYFARKRPEPLREGVRSSFSPRRWADWLLTPAVLTAAGRCCAVLGVGLAAFVIVVKVRSRTRVRTAGSRRRR